MINGTDYLIVKEILTHAYKEQSIELKRNPRAKLDQIRLISAYEFVLKQYGLDPLSDGHYYKLLMEMENSKTDLMRAMEEQDNISLASSHYLRCLMAKSFFALV